MPRRRIATALLALAAAGAVAAVPAGVGAATRVPDAAGAVTVPGCVPGSSRDFCLPIAIASDGTHVWVVSETPLKGGPGAGAVTELNAKTGTIVNKIFGATYRFNRPFAVSSDGKHVWVANASGNSVTELVPTTGKLVKVISGSTYRFDAPGRISSNGTHVWVADYGNNGVSEFNASTGDHRKTIS